MEKQNNLSNKSEQTSEVKVFDSFKFLNGLNELLGVDDEAHQALMVSIIKSPMMLVELHGSTVGGEWAKKQASEFEHAMQDMLGEKGESTSAHITKVLTKCLVDEVEFEPNSEKLRTDLFALLKKPLGYYVNNILEDTAHFTGYINQQGKVTKYIMFFYSTRLILVDEFYNFLATITVAPISESVSVGCVSPDSMVKTKQFLETFSENEKFAILIEKSGYIEFQRAFLQELLEGDDGTVLQQLLDKVDEMDAVDTSKLS